MELKDIRFSKSEKLKKIRREIRERFGDENIKPDKKGGPDPRRIKAEMDKLENMYERGAFSGKKEKEFINKMGNGVPVLDTVTKKCFIKQTHKNQFRIILTQGINRQIRRMCEFLNYRVKDLKRIRIMNIKLDVKVGKWRYFKPDELNTLNQLLNQSSKTHH